MSKEKIIRLACIALVGTVLTLAMILVIAVAGGMLTPPAAEESMDPHFRPFSLREVWILRTSWILWI